MTEANLTTDSRRNPYLILGIPFGASPETANKAFARASRLARRGESKHSLADLTWALHAVEHGADDPASLTSVYRVPANPAVYMDDLEGSLIPDAEPLERRTTSEDGLIERLTREASLGVLRDVVQARAAGSSAFYEI